MNTAVDLPAEPPVRKSSMSARQISAIVCAGIGLLGWPCALYLIGNYDDGEKLARFFQALVNVVILAVFGGGGVILSVIGIVLARWKTRLRGARVDDVAFWLSCAGLATGFVVVIATLPAALTHLQ